MTISYYTSIIIMCYMMLGALGVLVYKNNRIPRKGKQLLYLTYALIAVSALAEWIGVELNGREDSPRWLLAAVKCMDYILTPIAGGTLVIQMKLRNRWQKAMIIILVLNAVFQVFTAVFGGMIVIDDHHRYSHGPLFPVYLGVCFTIYTFIILQFRIFGRSYQRQNRASLYAVMLLVIVGIVMQELADSSIRTAYLGMTSGAALMFIHTSEFSQLSAESHIARQEHELQTDSLTGLQNRYAFSHALNRYASADSLPEGFAAFSIDVNDLKRVNDTLGHEAGDELIRGAAGCITQAFGSGDYCYRTGGDEFVILAPDVDEEAAEKYLARLKEAADTWRCPNGQPVSVAAGWALAKDNPGLNAEELVRKSDLAMYQAKAEYYRLSGRDRRRSR